MRKLGIAVGVLLLCQLAGSLEAAPVAMVEFKSKQGLINQAGEVVLPLSFEQLELVEGKELVIVKQNSKLGLYTREGKKVLAPRFERLTALRNGFVAGESSGKWSFYTQEGQKLEGEYREVGAYEDGLAPVRKDKLWGYIDTKGQEVIAPQFKEAHSFSEGKAAVKLDKLWGYIDTKGREVVPYMYKQAQDYHSGRALVNKQLWLNEKGQQIAILGRYSYVGALQPNGVVPVGQYHRQSSFLDYVGIGIGFGHWGYYDWFDHGWGALLYMNPSLLVPQNMQMGYLNKQGVEIVSTKNDYVGPFVDDLAIVGNGNKWGMVNTDGLTVIPYMYERLLPFSNGLAAFRYGHKWGFIDRANNMITVNKFDRVTSFFGPRATAVLQGQGGIIDQDGNFLIPPKKEYKTIRALKCQRAAVKLQGKWGFVDEEMAVAVPPSYDEVGDFQE